jgi:hypothetical protein
MDGFDKARTSPGWAKPRRPLASGSFRVRSAGVAWSVSGALMLVAAGCCGPLVVSHRYAANDGIMDGRCGTEREAAGSCGCAHVVDHLLHHAPLPGTEGGKALGTIQPPHSRFHPVPVRPVFAPRTPDEP